jgi:hypothetical protein
MKAPPAQKDFGRVPTLTPGRDALPTACQACGSTWLSRAAQLAGELFGAVSCGACGSLLAYLRPSARPIPKPRTAPPPLPSTASTAAPTPTPAPPAEPDWRRPDCDERCVRVRALLVGSYAVGRYDPAWIEAHNPDAHAQHQAALTVAVAVLCALPPPAQDVVVGTGPLAVDLSAHRCMVDGALVHVPPTELALLEYFARRLGQTRTAEAATAGVWADGDTATDRRFRVTLARLLVKLGPARRLLATRPGFGYALLDEPYTGPTAFPETAARERSPDPRWSRHYVACVLCGTTDRPYQARGLCHRCYVSSRPPNGWPDTRPKKDARP